MRCAKSYSIVDHQFLHGGYFQKLSPEALALYLFLVVVGDKNGRSFYADSTIEGILRLSSRQLTQAREELIRCLLVAYRKPYWWVKDIPHKELSHERPQTKNTVLQRRPGVLLSSDPTPVGDLAKEGLENLLKKFHSKGDQDDQPPLSSR